MIRFAKAHAYGNDFLYIDRGDIKGVALPALAREICDRHTGIGADGLIVYGRTAAGATMELFNADGGRAEVSGNGLRALAALLLLDDDRDGADVTITTDAGPKRVTRVKMPRNLPTEASAEVGRPIFRTAMGLPSDVKQVKLDAAFERVDAVVARDYRQALNDALDARDRAQTASRTTVDNKARTQTDADRALHETALALVDARAKLRAAEGRRSPRIVMNLRRDIVDAETRVQEARTALEAGDYLTANELLTKTMASLNDSVRTLETGSAAGRKNLPPLRGR